MIFISKIYLTKLGTFRYWSNLLSIVDNKTYLRCCIVARQRPQFLSKRQVVEVFVMISLTMGKLNYFEIFLKSCSCCLLKLRSKKYQSTYLIHIVDFCMIYQSQMPLLANRNNHLSPLLIYKGHEFKLRTALSAADDSKLQTGIYVMGR